MINHEPILGFSGDRCLSGTNPQLCCFKSIPKKNPRKDGSVFYQKIRGLIVWKKNTSTKRDESSVSL